MIISPLLLNPPTLPELPPPGQVEYWIFESPWMLSLVLIAVGILIAGTLRHTNHRQSIALPALVLGFVLGGAVLLTGHLVITDRERLKDHTTRLVTATANADLAALDKLLDEHVRVQTRFVTQSGKDRILKLAASRVSPTVDQARAKKVQVGLFGPQMARTYVKIKVDAKSAPPISWWQIDWSKPSSDSDHWQATHIEPLWIPGFPNPAGSKSLMD